jgi:hypothetical protein
MRNAVALKTAVTKSALAGRTKGIAIAVIGPRALGSARRGCGSPTQFAFPGIGSRMSFALPGLG